MNENNFGNGGGDNDDAKKKKKPVSLAELGVEVNESNEKGQEGDSESFDDLIAFGEEELGEFLASNMPETLPEDAQEKLSDIDGEAITALAELEAETEVAMSPEVVKKSNPKEELAQIQSEINLLTGTMDKELATISEDTVRAKALEMAQGVPSLVDGFKKAAKSELEDGVRNKYQKALELAEKKKNEAQSSVSKEATFKSLPQQIAETRKEIEVLNKLLPIENDPEISQLIDKVSTFKRLGGSELQNTTMADLRKVIKRKTGIDPPRSLTITDYSNISAVIAKKKSKGTELIERFKSLHP
jgi:hypothetical protein